jgi:peptide/nickel transport system permease protein
MSVTTATRAEASTAGRAWLGLKGGGIVLFLSFFWVFVVIVCAVAGVALSPHSPVNQDLSTGMVFPNGTHWLGTNRLGIDVLSIIMAGTRTAVIGPVIIAVGTMIGGALVGLVAGYSDGWLSTVILRWIDFMYALPGLIVSIVIVGVVGGGYWMAVVVLIVLSVPFDARVVRDVVLTQRGLHYVEAAQLLGMSRSRILFKDVWPNVMPYALAKAFLNFAASLVTLTSLSFLGLGVRPGTPDWGLLLAQTYPDIARNPWASIGPGVVIVLTASAVNIVGDWIYESFSDRGRGR